MKNNEYNYLEYIAKREEEFQDKVRPPYRDKVRKDTELYELIRLDR